MSSNPKKKKFKSSTEEERQVTKARTKAENTHKATKQWVSVFQEYLMENDCGDIDAIETDKLPNIPEKFCYEIRKITKDEPGQSDLDNSDNDTDEDKSKNSSLRAI